ncbi:SGNH/GDSL hydrolase family protein [Cellulomonas sp.]|uniref:SGNH/GDSL hydrolase family protein n=1 Tax=Cellulomonas sp. TaxID=40001 RepID=UPI001B2E38F3|nr:SGNH/GDSL hydrolase family protein [Cellulomonas sp.]MBO9553652.1 SGNH/GDSL hydrolase family protein [Cellulomonas sp.]
MRDVTTTFLQPHDRVLLTGDSVTDGGRDRDDPASLGHGYAAIVAALAGARRPDLALTFLNRGVGGDTSAMLRARWERDALALSPTVVSVLIGINDTWRRYDSGVRTSTGAYEEHLRAMLDAARERLDARLVLVEPFLVPVDAAQHGWREDLDPRISVVRRLAAEHRAVLVPADGLFAAAAVRTGPTHWVSDGVHPTPAGFGLLAEAWLDAVGVPGR